MNHNFGWGGRIWTLECGNQNPEPYRLATPQWKALVNGWGSWTRTNACENQNLVPYRLGYTPIKWWGGRWDLNPRPPDPQSGALTNCATSTMLTGAPEGIRTPDPRLRRAMLYPAELLAHIGAGDGNRTHVTSLEGWGSTIELHPHIVIFAKRIIIISSIKTLVNNFFQFLKFIFK